MCASFCITFPHPTTREVRHKQSVAYTICTQGTDLSENKYLSTSHWRMSNFVDLLWLVADLNYSDISELLRLSSLVRARTYQCYKEQGLRGRTFVSLLPNASLSHLDKRNLIVGSPFGGMT